ncbi:hypothetical protein PV11_09423 [Exophiala sideris]|uniref:Zn(2)-C6 fungal-type domain-containing protein n=1 Tax=Exophiala sideris TaxID=1016849 RepID=A0A0D1VNS1_9EURO|nr:hypothetical protein PV11_09423 [Exophiala sideris]
MEFLPPSTLVQSRQKQPKFRRAPIACRRCRRLRVRCRHVSASPPCESCSQTGHECIFPQRGEPDFDRAYRHERIQRGPNVGGQPTAEPDSQIHESQPRSHGRSVATHPAEPQHETEDLVSLEGSEMQASDRSSATAQSGWNLLPPLEEVVEGSQVFIRSYFQLGFLAKTRFFERLQKQREIISVFLLLGILSISARFTPSLIRRYGNGQNATNSFLQKAARMAVDHMYKPSLEAIQSFFLISLAEWGKGDKDRSSTHMGIAVRMAGSLRLHREETYVLPDNATNDEIVESEVARRTFWMLENHDNLHSGYNSAVSFSLNDITTLLPCEEQEFAFGTAPRERAALMGTASATNNNQLTKSPSRSLFATLVQCHNIWGQIARRASGNGLNQQHHANSPFVDTTLSESEHIRLTTLLKDFEDNLPAKHRWSVWNLRGFKAEGLDLAYLSVVTMIRLSNIILRRTSVKVSGGKDDAQCSSTPNRPLPPSTLGCEEPITTELFSNMVVLNEQIEAFFSLQSPDQGFPAFIIYCVYICGTLASHLQKSDDLVEAAADAVSRTVVISDSSTRLLSDLQCAWPMAKRWSDNLLNLHQSQAAGESSVAAGEESYASHSIVQSEQHPGVERMVTASRLNSSQDEFPAFTATTAADYPGLFEALEPDDIDSILEDPWYQGLSGISLMENLDSDLAFNLWPGGDIWQS